MKTILKLILSCLFIFWLTSSCSPDDSSDLFIVNDFTITIDENPIANSLIGKISSKVDPSKFLIYSIMSPATDKAISILNYPETGLIYVNDAALFDFETNPVIKSAVTVYLVRYKLDFSTETLDSKTITVTINLKDLPE
ncbi:hypothetical protein VP395_15175 [Mariniflexile soesokkakense]|uniref:Cadherin domain-containing protein n=1 Tax=Mariniflexile soesokkakense TaxID=1343160 RepID=A0ABV0ADQ8_9FLAO